MTRKSTASLVVTLFKHLTQNWDGVSSGGMKQRSYQSQSHSHHQCGRDGSNPQDGCIVCDLLTQQAPKDSPDGHQPPDVMFLAHPTDTSSGFAFWVQPCYPLHKHYEAAWWMPLFSPFIIIYSFFWGPVSGALGASPAIRVDSFPFHGMKTESWVMKWFGWLYFIKPFRSYLADQIEEVMRRADARGVKVLGRKRCLVC